MEDGKNLSFFKTLKGKKFSVGQVKGDKLQIPFDSRTPLMATSFQKLHILSKILMMAKDALTRILMGITLL